MPYPVILYYTITITITITIAIAIAMAMAVAIAIAIAITITRLYYRPRGNSLAWGIAIVFCT